MAVVGSWLSGCTHVNCQRVTEEVIEITTAGARCSRGDCSEARGNFSRGGIVFIPVGIFPVNKVVTVYETVHIRLVVCFTVCMFYFN